MCLGRLWYPWDAAETDTEQMKQDRGRKFFGLVTLKALLWMKVWQYPYKGTTGHKEKGNKRVTELFLLGGGFYLLVGNAPAGQYCSQQCCLGIMLLWVLSRPAAPSCTGADLSCPWLCCWFTVFVLRGVSALKRNTIFTMSVTFFQVCAWS